MYIKLSFDLTQKTHKYGTTIIIHVVPLSRINEHIIVIISLGLLKLLIICYNLRIDLSKNVIKNLFYF